MAPYLVGAKMKLTSIIALVVISAAIGFGPVQAQILDKSAVPAEFPPESFTGNQYVDSNGCIFIRAGISGNVTWVPRVGRDRKQICGYQPSAAGVGTLATPDARTASNPPVQIIPDATPAPATTTSVVPATVKAAPKPLVRRTTLVTAPITSQKYVSTAPRKKIRAATQARNGSTGETVLVPQGTRVLPRHVYENRKNTRNADEKVPKGYRTVWTDGRLNLRRAEQTLEGHAKMKLVWTNTVPRRLVDATTGAEASVPTVFYTTTTTGARSASVSSKNRNVAPSGATAGLITPRNGSPVPDR